MRLVARLLLHPVCHYDEPEIGDSIPAMILTGRAFVVNELARPDSPTKRSMVKLTPNVMKRAA